MIGLFDALTERKSQEGFENTNEPLVVGDKFTLSAWKGRFDRSYLGAAMEVIHVEEPFIIAKSLTDRYDRDKNVTFYLPEVLLKKVSDKFVELSQQKA